MIFKTTRLKIKRINSLVKEHDALCALMKAIERNTEKGLTGSEDYLENCRKRLTALEDVIHQLIPDTK